MGKATYRGLKTEEYLRKNPGFVLSRGRLLTPGSEEHVKAIVEAQKAGDHVEAGKLLSKLPERTPESRQ